MGKVSEIAVLMGFVAISCAGCGDQTWDSTVRKMVDFQDNVLQVVRVCPTNEIARAPDGSLWLRKGPWREIDGVASHWPERLADGVDAKDVCS